jgi:hypothetical protein
MLHPEQLRKYLQSLKLKKLIMYTGFIILQKYFNWIDRVIFHLSGKIRVEVNMV